MTVYYVDGQVGVRLGELGEQLVVKGAVDGGPQTVTALSHLLDVVGVGYPATVSLPSCVKGNGRSYLVGSVDRPRATSSGRLLRNAPRQLIVRGMPLNPMHFRPTSRINSAVSTAVCWSSMVVTRLNSSFIEAGEFMVMDVAVLKVVQSQSFATQEELW